MKRKPIRINWDELESAFDNKREDLVYYLDLVTGHVVLEGEGEDLLEDDEELPEEAGGSDAAVRHEGTRLYIDPLGPEDESGWLGEFVAEAEGVDPAVLGRVKEALAGANPVDAFRELLRTDAELSELWFLYRAERIHDAIDAWLDANEVRSSEPAPWHG